MKDDLFTEPQGVGLLLQRLAVRSVADQMALELELSLAQGSASIYQMRLTFDFVKRSGADNLEWSCVVRERCLYRAIGKLASVDAAMDHANFVTRVVTAFVRNDVTVVERDSNDRTRSPHFLSQHMAIAVQVGAVRREAEGDPSKAMNDVRDGCRMAGEVCMQMLDSETLHSPRQQHRFREIRNCSSQIPTAASVGSQDRT